MDDSLCFQFRCVSELALGGWASTKAAARVLLDEESFSQTQVVGLGERTEVERVLNKVCRTVASDKTNDFMGRGVEAQNRSFTHMMTGWVGRTEEERDGGE